MCSIIFTFTRSFNNTWIFPESFKTLRLSGLKKYSVCCSIQKIFNPFPNLQFCSQTWTVKLKVTSFIIRCIKWYECFYSLLLITSWGVSGFPCWESQLGKIPSELLVKAVKRPSGFMKACQGFNFQKKMLTSPSCHLGVTVTKIKPQRCSTVKSWCLFYSRHDNI